MKTGTQLIAIERERQKQKWDEEHDAGHTAGDLSVVAAMLAVYGTDAKVVDALDRDDWGLIEKADGNRIRVLVIAGALIAAEIDRVLSREVDRMAAGR